MSWFFSDAGKASDAKVKFHLLLVCPDPSTNTAAVVAADFIFFQKQSWCGFYFVLSFTSSLKLCICVKALFLFP